MNRWGRHSTREQTRRSIWVYGGLALVVLWLIGAGGASTDLLAQSATHESPSNSVETDLDGGATSEVAGPVRNARPKPMDSILGWIVLLSVVAYLLWQQHKQGKDIKT